VNEREAFLKALADNENDTTTRLVYADWLDERGEHEEAERQRNWPAAKAWLVQLCLKHNPPPDGDVWVISYEELLDLGRQTVKEADDEGLDFSCGNNIEMCDALRDNSQEFWKNWSVITGVPLPPDVEEKTYFRCCC
jgi:uncharacterized protein (TIGR02996 family)